MRKTSPGSPSPRPRRPTAPPAPPASPRASAPHRTRASSCLATDPEQNRSSQADFLERTGATLAPPASTNVIATSGSRCAPANRAPAPDRAASAADGELETQAQVVVRVLVPGTRRVTRSLAGAEGNGEHLPGDQLSVRGQRRRQVAVRGRPAQLDSVADLETVALAGVLDEPHDLACPPLGPQ